MNRLAEYGIRSIVAAGAGFGFETGVTALIQHSQLPASEQYAAITACARELGSAAVQAEAVPGNCVAYAGSFAVARQGSGADMVLTYSLPAASEFTAEQLTEQKTQTGANDKIDIGAGSVMGLGVFIFLSPKQLTAYRKRFRTKPVSSEV